MKADSGEVRKRAEPSGCLHAPQPFAARVASHSASRAAGPPLFSTSDSPPAAAGSPCLQGPHRPAVSAASQFATRRDSPSGQLSGPIGRIALPSRPRTGRARTGSGPVRYPDAMRAVRLLLSEPR
ncbi:hypothetical protein GCM10010207_09740 [Streptomyces atratus]|nr:hypothetical protein GCM10010207_09740 [Streptomyces atratus]